MSLAVGYISSGERDCDFL